MGLFSKIKDILFEDDGEEATAENMPVFTNEDNKVEKKEDSFETTSFVDDDDEPLRVATGSRFKNDKRDIELGDVELDGNNEVVPKEKEEESITKLEDSSPILPFDEDEFDRMNSRNYRPVEKAPEKSVRDAYQERENLFRNVDARKANNNFSSTDAPRERYESVTSTSVVKEDRKFKPSPVISPVYGILDKNYKKEEIVDRVGGLKREKKVKPKEEVKEEVKIEKINIEEEKDFPILKEDLAKEQTNKEEIVKEEPISVDLDSVRKKAFGSIDSLLETALEEVKNSNKKEEVHEEPVKEVPAEKVPVEEIHEEVVPEKVHEEIKEDKPLDIPEVVEEEPILDREEKKEEVNEGVVDDVVVDTSNDKMIEDLLDEKPTVEPPNDDVSDLILQDIDEDHNKDKTLDDLEKTSTLKILDDIEKELNDIEPVAKKDNLENTLESDLFNLIDSMYEKGEDE